MKRVVVSSGLQEKDIRPPALMSEFKRLSIHDAAEFFADPARREAVPCPACGADEPQPVFNKFDFLYNKCRPCGSVYVSPRPTEAALEDYYQNSSASQFRVQHFSRDTARARRYHLLRSHALWMCQICDEAGNPDARGFADIGTHSPEIFDELQTLGYFGEYASADPLLPVNEGTAVPVRTAALEELHGQGAISAFEKLEHQFSPRQFIRNAAGALAEGGLLFFTTRTITGFDLQVLWDKAPYIFVPEHLNLLSVEGIARLIQQCDLDLVELSTPGQLDLQLVKHAAEQDPSIKLPHFVHYLLHQRDALAHEDFQAFLQKHRLSSHVRVAAQKRKMSN